MTHSGSPHGWTPYCGAAPLPSELLARWNFDPGLIIALALLAYAGLRWSPPERRQWLVAAFGLVLLLFVSPFCALTSALFSTRVIHHLLLTAAVAPLLVLSIDDRSQTPGSLTLWTALQAVTFWLWHAPQLYSAALSSITVYWAMQISLIVTALGFWSALRAASAPAAVAALLATTVQMGLLGALITFAAAPLYSPHLDSTTAWGFSPLEDQQLAGLIMWVPAAGLYLGAALFISHRWLASDSQAVAR